MRKKELELIEVLRKEINELKKAQRVKIAEFEILKVEYITLREEYDELKYEKRKILERYEKEVLHTK